MKFYGHAELVAQRIISAFEAPEHLPKALAPIFIHRKDDLPSSKWSWHNRLLVVMSGSHDARGIKQWKNVGRNLVKGCHAVWILAPCLKEIEDSKPNHLESKKTILYGFRSIPVFRVEDTEGSPLPPVDGSYGNWLRQLPLIEVAQAWNIRVDTYSHNGTSGPEGYFRYGGTAQQAILLGVENLGVWLHELVHAADYRLANRNAESAERWYKELVAELGSSVLLEVLGQEAKTNLGGAYSYIRGYAESAQKSVVSGCITVLDRTCAAVSLILDTAESLQEAAAVPA